jgi:putative ABC transport system permease protein
MRRIALLSLLHDRGKLGAAIAGVAFAGMLVLIQSGIYQGFRVTSSTLIEHVGGDLWVTGRGCPVLDNGEPLSAGVRMLARSDPAVARVRPLIFSFHQARKRGGGVEYVEVVATEALPGRLVPWSLEAGLPEDVERGSRVAIDRSDLGKLELPDDPIGSEIEIGGETLHVAAVTQGIHGFTLSPYVFTDPLTARRILGMTEEEATYWIVDLADPSAASSVKQALERHPELQVRTRDDFARATEDYWVNGSGAGIALAVSAILGVIVGIVVVSQTLYTLTTEHLRELAMLKAIGATARELASFVGVQAGFIALAGGGLGMLLAFAGQRVVERAGLAVALSPGVLALGTGTILGICVLASVGSVRTVVRVEAARVFA